jgi:hypothetical protein
MSQNDCLKRKLKNAMIECLKPSGRYMIPRDLQRSLITKEAIIHETVLQGITIEEEEALVICNEYLQLFGILAYMDKAAEIKAFMAEKITDKELPLKRDRDKARKRDYLLRGQGGKTFDLLDDWDESLCKKFCKAQSLMTSPLFELHGHYQFDDSTVLPFIDDPAKEGEAEVYRGGGYSEIHTRYIHPSHHEFGDSSVIIKSLSINTTLCSPLHRSPIE